MHFYRGKCEVHDGKARCSCNQGFVGDDCSLDDQVGVLLTIPEFLK